MIPAEAQALLQEIQEIEEEICLAEKEGDDYVIMVLSWEKRGLEEELETLTW